MTTNLVVFNTYFESISSEKSGDLARLAKVISDNISEGFEPQMQYNMPSWVVPLSVYPAGYHCKPETPLPFISIAAQKNHLALYHMGLYAHKALMDWFEQKLLDSGVKKPDMGKSCIRFKYGTEIPFSIIGELCGKMQPAEWIQCYESAFRK